MDARMVMIAMLMDEAVVRDGAVPEEIDDLFQLAASGQELHYASPEEWVCLQEWMPPTASFYTHDAPQPNMLFGPMVVTPEP